MQDDDILQPLPNDMLDFLNCATPGGKSRPGLVVGVDDMNDRGEMQQGNCAVKIHSIQRKVE